MKVHPDQGFSPWPEEVAPGNRQPGLGVRGPVKMVWAGAGQGLVTLSTEVPIWLSLGSRAHRATEGRKQKGRTQRQAVFPLGGCGALSL